MKKNWLFCILVVLMTACSGIPSLMSPANPSPTAKEFKSESGGFSVVTAAELQEQVFPAVTLGVVRPEIHSFSGTLNDSSYDVRYYVVSGGNPSTTSPETILGIADYYLLSIDGLPSDPTTLGVDGYYRRELSFEHQENRYKVLLILVANPDNPNWDGSHVYAVFISSPTGSFNETEADDFINSFKLLK